MNDKGVTAVIVTAAGKPSGIFTERDVLKRVAVKEINAKETPIKQVMTTPMITMPAAALVGDVLAEMYHRDIRNMPVRGDRRRNNRHRRPCRKFFNLRVHLISMNRSAAVGKKSPNISTQRINTRRARGSKTLSFKGEYVRIGELLDRLEGGRILDTPAINDLNICVATENGSGSASSNNILFKAIFKMGIPCSSKNMFPSNIQGLPTWYQIRASAEGYLSRKDVIDVMVMFNDATAAKDIYRVRDGGLILYDDSTPLAANLKRDGVQYIGFPANKLVAKLVPASPLRAKQRNMVYVGALAYLFGIDMSVIKAVLEDTFGKKPAVIESNLICIDAGYQYCKEQGYKQNIARLRDDS